MISKSEYQIIKRITLSLFIAGLLVVAGSYAAGRYLANKTSVQSSGGDFDTSNLEGLVKTGQVGPESTQKTDANGGRYQPSTADVEQVYQGQADIILR